MNMPPPISHDNEIPQLALDHIEIEGVGDNEEEEYKFEQPPSQPSN
jgi:hypothetical protein